VCFVALRVSRDVKQSLRNKPLRKSALASWTRSTCSTPTHAPSPPYKTRILTFIRVLDGWAQLRALTTLEHIERRICAEKTATRPLSTQQSPFVIELVPRSSQVSPQVSVVHRPLPLGKDLAQDGEGLKQGKVSTRSTRSLLLIH